MQAGCASYSPDPRSGQTTCADVSALAQVLGHLRRVFFGSAQLAAQLRGFSGHLRDRKSTCAADRFDLLPRTTSAKTDA
jgi:hypothetical protein